MKGGYRGSLCHGGKRKKEGEEVRQAHEKEGEGENPKPSLIPCRK